jgi:Spy/CpxP family protein refolding chaperone
MPVLIETKDERAIKTVLAFTSVVLVLAALSLTSCARHWSPEERADWVTKRIAKHLDLDQQQTAKLEAVKQEMLAARAKLSKEHQALLDDAVAQIQAERLDQAKVLQLLERRQELHRQVAPQVVAKIAEFHASLTPEQKAKAVEHLRRFGERMGYPAVAMEAQPRFGA